MFHMLSCFDLSPEVDFSEFQQAYGAFVRHMQEIGLAESSGPIGKRQNDTPMDTDDERQQQYFVIMSFRDRPQVDAAYALIEGRDERAVEFHQPVLSKIKNAIFICWQDME